VNDHRNHRRGDPAWPTGDEPREQPQERTGFWSPLWEDDDDEPVGRHNGRSNGQSGNGNGHGRDAGHRAGGSRHGVDANGWPTSPPRDDTPPPRPAPRSLGGAAGAAGGAAAGNPAWPTQEPTSFNRPPAGGARPPAGPPPRGPRARPAGPPRPGGPGGPTGPGGIPEGPTELLPPVGGFGTSTGPEPALLTHREPDYDQDFSDDPDLDDEEPPDEPQLTAEQLKKRRRKKIWRRVRRTMYVFTALMIIVPTVAFFIAYQVVEVPNAEQVAAGQGQSVTLTFANGETMTTVVPPGGENRRMVTYEELPEIVKNAVFAAEDAEFMTNPGFDITGVMTAAWNQVTGGDGGGSTITQQYIKKASGEDDATLTRKALEVVKAYKMNNTYSKELILESYLNTIYFGRSAYGISAAGKAYFGKELKDLTASEAALLAGMIQNPGRDKDQEYMERRWKFVMGQMVDKGWLPAADREAAVFPTLIDRELARPRAETGPKAHIQEAVFRELENGPAKLSLEEIHRKGLTIRTTIDQGLQTQAEAAVTEVLAGQPDTLRPALVATDPKTGNVVAYYGGSNGIGSDWAGIPQEPGSSFKPFDLVALLQQGKGLAEIYDGTSGRTFEGRDAPVRNSNNATCGEQCTVAEAMRRSINTVFYDMALNTTGTGKVADAAAAAGITSPLRGPNGENPDGNIAIGGGQTQVTTAEMSSAYATFAAGGIYNKPRLVAEVLYPDGRVAWKAPGPTQTPAFDKTDSRNNQKIARNVTEALEPVLEYNDLECADGRECAGKTGTHQYDLGDTNDNAKAWMVGYTPQLSTAVSLAAEGPDGKRLPLRDKNDDIIYGGDLPGQIWKTFMDSFLENVPEEGFGKFVPIGERVSDNNGSSTNSPSNPGSQTTTTDPTTTTETTETETSTETTTEDGPRPGCPPLCGGMDPPPTGG
jgi:membrane peptidoglycan carboxypeptidase